MIETGATITPSPVNPLGVKGVGEAGTIAATPVIVNAVIDALSGLGVRHIDMPLRPEKVWQAPCASTRAERQRAIGASSRRRHGMIPKEFDYVAPGSVAEALAPCSDGGEDAKILAGGHSLIPLMKLRLAAPSRLVDLRHIGDLRGVDHDAHGQLAVIGAMTTYQELDAGLPACWPSARPAWAIPRCGREAPSAAAWPTPTRQPTCPPPSWPSTRVLGASHLNGDGSTVAERDIAAADFFVDLLTTALEPGEILTTIFVPDHRFSNGSGGSSGTRLCQGPQQSLALCAGRRGGGAGPGQRWRVQPRRGRHHRGCRQAVPANQRRKRAQRHPRRRQRPHRRPWHAF